MSRSSGAPAFTLIELIAVIVLTAIIGAAIAGTTLSYVSSFRTRGAAAQIATSVRFAQRWALSTRNRTWVAFNVAGNSYTLYVENPSSPGKAGRLLLARPLDGATGAVTISDAPFTGVTLSSASIEGTSEVEFDSLGRPYNASSAALTASGTIQLGGGVTVSVLPVSGLVEVTG